MFYVYLLKNERNDEVYVGSTIDLSRRFQEHNEGKVSSTKRYMPWHLIYYEAYPAEKLAREREQKLKYHGSAFHELRKRLGFTQPQISTMSHRTYSSDKAKIANQRFGAGFTQPQRPGAGFTQPHGRGAGFTIPELLVALLAFSLVIGGATNLLLTGIAAQRSSLATQELLDQSSFMTEYVTRVLRQARKDTAGTCLTLANLNYEVSSNGVSWSAEGSGSFVRFVNGNGQCQQFSLESVRIQETIFPAPGEYLTSDNLNVTSLRFLLEGSSQEDDVQPKVTFAMEIEGQGSKPESKPSIQLQSTVSQRRIDVPE